MSSPDLKRNVSRSRAARLCSSPKVCLMSSLSLPTVQTSPTPCLPCTHLILRCLGHRALFLLQLTCLPSGSGRREYLLLLRSDALALFRNTCHAIFFPSTVSFSIFSLGGRVFYRSMIIYSLLLLLPPGFLLDLPPSFFRAVMLIGAFL